MPKSKIAITLDNELLQDLGDLVRRRRFANRSRAIEAAVREKLDLLRGVRLARKCALLDPDEGLRGDGAEWPEY